MKNWSILESKKDYEVALNRVEMLMNSNPRVKTDLGKELKLLLYLIELYEEENYPIGFPDPIAAVKIRMEDLGLEPKDLVAAIGDKGTVSKVVNNKIPLSLRMIRNLSNLHQLPSDILIQESKLVEA